MEHILKSDKDLLGFDNVIEKVSIILKTIESLSIGESIIYSIFILIPTALLLSKVLKVYNFQDKGKKIGLVIFLLVFSCALALLKYEANIKMTEFNKRMELNIMKRQVIECMIYYELNETTTAFLSENINQKSEIIFNMASRFPDEFVLLNKSISFSNAKNYVSLKLKKDKQVITFLENNPKITVDKFNNIATKKGFYYNNKLLKKLVQNSDELKGSKIRKEIDNLDSVQLEYKIPLQSIIKVISNTKL